MSKNRFIIFIIILVAVIVGVSVFVFTSGRKNAESNNPAPEKSSTILYKAPTVLTPRPANEAGGGGGGDKKKQ
jgi:hypothetical protein